jgi:hypothetical protein
MQPLLRIIAFKRTQLSTMYIYNVYIYNVYIYIYVHAVSLITAGTSPCKLNWLHHVGIA